MDCESETILHQDPTAALAVSSEALARSRSLDPQPLQSEARILGRMARIHANRGEWPMATRLYQEALAIANRTLNPIQMAKTYEQLSLAYTRLGDHTSSLRYRHKALAEHGQKRQCAIGADLESSLGLAFIKQGLADDAEIHLKRSLEIWTAGGEDGRCSDVLVSLAELYLAQGRSADAHRCLAEAAVVAEASGRATTRARVHELLGQLAAARGDSREVDHEFATAIAILSEASDRELLMRCHALYAKALEDRGDIMSALHHLKLAVLAMRPLLLQTEDKTDHMDASTVTTASPAMELMRSPGDHPEATDPERVSGLAPAS
jgi:tetratricopeptide (TPR) repeat protein